MSDAIVFADSSAPQAQEPHAGSFPRRVIDTFFSPVALFSRFGTRPPWVDVMVLSVVLGAIAFALVPMEVWVATMEEAMRAQPDAPPMDPEAMARVQRIGGMVSVVLVPWIMAAAVAGLMVLVFSVALGGRATFRQYLSVVAHVSLVGAVGQLVALPIMIQKGVMSSGITLGALAVGMDPESPIHQFLSTFNVFVVWQLVLLALAVSTLNRKIGTGTALAVMLGLNVLVALVRALV